MVRKKAVDDWNIPETLASQGTVIDWFQPWPMDALCFGRTLGLFFFLFFFGGGLKD